MRHNIFYSCFALMVLTFCTSCDNEDEWQPGEAVPAGTPVVYFSSDNPPVIGHLGDDNSSFRLTLERLDTNGELTVPIVVNSVVGDIQVPASATFADGDDQTDITVTYTYMPGMSLSLSLGSGFGHPYLEQDGTVSYSCSIAKLKPLCKVQYTDESTLSATESYIYSFEGMNRFRFTNFLDSHVDVTFTISTVHTGVKFNADKLRSLRGDFVPVDNNYVDGEGWYLYDGTTGEYPVWTPTGWDKAVHYCYCYDYQTEISRSYSYIDFRDVNSEGNPRECYFWGTTFYHDEDFTSYSVTNVKYTLDFDAQF